MVKTVSTDMCYQNHQLPWEKFVKVIPDIMITMTMVMKDYMITSGAPYKKC